MASESRNTLRNMDKTLSDHQQNQHMTPEALPSPRSRAVVIGLYGVSGCGKSFLLNQLKQELAASEFIFYEGSEMIASIVAGGLEEFHRLDEAKRLDAQKLAIETIGREAAESGRAAVVAGHFMFWPIADPCSTAVHTESDFNIFTHMIYLNPAADVVARRRGGDENKIREAASASHIFAWQETERNKLESLCCKHGIIFWKISSISTALDAVVRLLRISRTHTEAHSLEVAMKALDEAIQLQTTEGKLRTVLVVDADKTLGPVDASKLFFHKYVQKIVRDCPESDVLKPIFQRLGYTYAAFLYVMHYYEGVASDEQFEHYCDEVLADAKMAIYPEFVSLLQVAVQQDHVGAVVIICGNAHIWTKILERECLSNKIKVIGGCRMSDGYVVTPDMKAALVTRLQIHHGVKVWAFGDSPVDLKMLDKADEAIIVVGDEQLRSKAMEAELLHAIEHEGLKARQVLLPSTVSPRLDFNRLPLASLTDQTFLHSVIGPYPTEFCVNGGEISSAALLLMTPMRDARVSGPTLREAHRRMGWYIATEYLTQTSIIGLEGFSIPDVQAHSTTGHRLLHEKETVIVALMRGGDPMALGINDAFPLAMFVNAGTPTDLKPHHIHGMVNIILVDSVVNSGKTVLEFVERVRNLHAAVRIIVVTDVAQEQAVKGAFAMQLGGYGNLSFIALRISRNKFTGRGGTDTGNRLYNTLQLP